MDKIYTFQIVSCDLRTNEEDEIQFCAYDMQEAVNLFYDYCDDLNLSKEERPAIVSIEIVYNKEDAEEYGEAYGSMPA